MNFFDVAIVGTGLGGLATALKLNPDLRIALISKGQILSGASPWAQGGIAAMTGKPDTVESYISDICIAGDGLCDVTAVRHVVENSGDVLDWLQAQGVPFTPDPDEPDEPHMTREGGHSIRRIAHVGDHEYRRYKPPTTTKQPHTKSLNQAILINESAAMTWPQTL